MTQFGSPTEDLVGRHERRIERLVDKSKRYIQRINAAYTRTVGSQPQSRPQERQLFEQARNDPVMAAQLLQEIRGRSVSTQAALETFIRWGQKFQ